MASAAHRTDGRTDQFALALMAFELLVGRRAYEADSSRSLLQLHQHAPAPDARQWRGDLDEQAAKAMQRALRKEPNQRYATCQQFAKALAGERPYERVAANVIDVPQIERHAVYLWHSSDESLVARQLADCLEEAGYSTWYYQRDALPGIPFLQQTRDAIRRSQAVVLLISKSTLSSSDLARDIREAHRTGHSFLPVLVGLSLEEFERHHPKWRSMLGAASVIELERNRVQDVAARLLSALPLLGISQGTHPATSTKPIARAVAGQIWATDASQIDVHDLGQLVFRNTIIDDFLNQAVRHLSRDAWTHIQAGLIEAAWELMNANPHVRVFATIRHEAFVNYQSDIKSNLFGATTVLRYSDDELEQLMDWLTHCYEGVDRFKKFLGFNVIKHDRRPAPEDSFHFVRRHSFGRPRDLVAIASELSAHHASLTETRYCDLVRRTSATALVSNVFDEMCVFLDCLRNREARARFLASLPANILTRQEAVEISANFNGLGVNDLRQFSEESASIFHPFRDLYLAGLLGVIAPVSEASVRVQKFRQTDDLVTDFGTPLPVSEYYFLHPALNGLIRQHRTTSDFLVHQHVMVGENVRWQDYDQYFCEVEKHVARISQQELAQAMHQLLKRAREVLQGGHPEQLKPLFEALPDWREAREALLELDAEDVLLNMEELLAVN